MPYSPELLFDIAADVERSPEYLPRWIEARVTRRAGDRYWTDQTIAFGPLRARFRSATTLCRPKRVDVTSREPPFRQFDLCWTVAAITGDTRRVVLIARLDLRSVLLERMVAPILKSIIRKIIAAFEARAVFRPAGGAGSMH